MGLINRLLVISCVEEGKGTWYRGDHEDDQGRCSDVASSLTRCQLAVSRRIILNGNEMIFPLKASYLSSRTEHDLSYT